MRFRNIMTLLTSEQLHRLQSLLNTLSLNQLIWISGYLYGLIHDKSDAQKKTFEIIKTQDVTQVNQKISIISASQTGNARQISEQLYHDCIRSGLNVILCNARDYKYKKITEEKLLIFITSTYGEGEPPEEAIALYKYLFSQNAPKLNNTSFVVLSLGDRSYEYFAKAGKDFDQKFAELGANRLCDRLDVDVDFKVEVDIWKKKIVSLFKEKTCLIFNKNQFNNVKDTIIRNNFVYSKEFPLIAHLLSRQKITSRNSIKDVHHLEIDISGSNLCYKPGDSLGVWYENDSDLINELLKIFHLKGHELIEINGKSISLDEALKKYYELTQNASIIVKNTAIVSKDKLLLDLINDKEQLNYFVSTTPIVDMMHQISARLTSQNLLQILRPMKPRFYSISSAQEEVGEEIHITVGVVRYKINGRLRSGGASSYLIDRLKENDEIRIFVQSNDNFRLPSNPNISIIMIGVGTGIAPFRSFIQKRSLNKLSGKNWLFFGNLKFIDDFLYQTEWQFYVKEGILNKINTAWSRDQEHKIYIQDKLLENSIELWNWIQDGAYVYVCGDAQYMARDVERTLIMLTSQHGNMSIDQANNFWNDMRVKNRYQRDVY